MSTRQKRQRLRKFLFKKFSMDKEEKCMMPTDSRKRKRRNDAQWIGFELTDDQLEQVIRDTMEAYLEHREHPQPLIRDVLTTH